MRPSQVHHALRRRVGGVAARREAQQTERVRKIGVLMHATSDEPKSQAQIVAFAQGLQEAGWSVGRNIRIETRWSTGDPRACAKTRRNWSRSTRTSC